MSLFDAIIKIYRRYDGEIFKVCAKAAEKSAKKISDIIEGNKEIDEFFEEFNKKRREFNKKQPKAEYIKIKVGPFEMIFERCRV